MCCLVVVVDLSGDVDTLAYVISTNLHRRHLNESQRSMVASKLANMERRDTLNRGSRSAKLQDAAISQPSAAAMLNVSPRSVADARKVRDSGIPYATSAIATMDYAEKLKAWPLVEDAVDAKIEDQRQFCAWWKANVRRVQAKEI